MSAHQLNTEICRLLGVDAKDVLGLNLSLQAERLPVLTVDRVIDVVTGEHLVTPFVLTPSGTMISQGALDVLMERLRQRENEGWDDHHDDGHAAGELAAAGSRYAINAAACLGVQPPCLDFGASWPWDESWFKPTFPRRDLVKAAALILAEIDRIDRNPDGRSE